MLLALIASLVLAALTGLAGLPLGLARPASRASLATLAIDSMLAGTALLICLLSLWTWVGPIVAILGLLAVLGAAVLGVRWGEPIDFSLLRPRWNWFVGGAAALFVVGMALRLRTVEFLPWAGDMGNYVNSANRLARTGQLDLGFPPGFGVYLAIPSWILGVPATTASVPFLGALLLGSVLRVTGQLRIRNEARLAALAVLSFSTVAVWYSSFPVSEALQAPLTIMLVSLVGAHVTSTDRTPSALLGDLSLLAITGFASGLTRGTGPLLLLPLVMLLAACLLPAWRHFGAASARALGATTGGLALSYVYGVHRIPGYFVELQISSLLPTRLFSIMSRLGLLRVSIPLVLLWTGIVAAAFAFGVVMDRWERASAARAPTDADGGDTAKENRWAWPLAGTAFLALATIALLLLEGPGEIWNQFGRMNPALLMIGLLALVLPGALRARRGPFVVLAASVMMLLLAVQVTRFDKPRAHSFFLYWDRYLFSEVLPILVVLAGLTVGVALEWTSRRVDRATASGSTTAAVRWARPTAVAFIALLVVAFVGTQVNGLRLVTRDTALAGTLEMFEELDGLLADRSRPIMWTASGEGPDGWPIFPNSWHAFGKTVEATYDREVVNLGPSDDPFQPDQVLDIESVSALLACTSEPSAYAVEFSREGNSDLDDRVAGSMIDIERVGDVSVDASILRHLNTKLWEEMSMRATVWEVTAPAGALPECATPE